MLGAVLALLNLVKFAVGFRQIKISPLVLTIQSSRYWRCGLENLFGFCPAFHITLLWFPRLIFQAGAKGRLTFYVDIGFTELGHLARGFLMI